MTTLWQDLKYNYQRGNSVIRLIMLNVAAHLGLNILLLPFFLFGISAETYWAEVQNWLYLPADASKLLIRPWTLFSYMFLHSGIWHLLMNMLVLYWFGRLLNNLLKDRQIWGIYLSSGLSGGLFFLLSYNLFPAFYGQSSTAVIVGASAGVMGVVLAAAALTPKASMRFILIGNVQLQYVALAFVLIDLVSVSLNNSGGHLAHLGGAAMGWLFIYLLRRGRDLSLPLHPLFEGRQAKVTPKSRPRPKMAYRKTESSSMQASAQSQTSNNNYGGYSRSFAQKYRHLSHQECVDAILDKIRSSGYDSLTKDEKTYLDESSQKK